MAQVQADVAELDAYARESSYGQCWFTPTFSGPHTIPGPVECGSDAIFTYARSIGIEPDDYEYKILVVPSTSGCTEGGGGQYCTIYAGSANRFEEFRHAWGLGHGGRYDCGAVPFDPDGCTWVERGDPYFGGSLHPPSVDKRIIRWVDPVEITQSGVYHITPYEIPGGTPVIKVRGEYDRGNGIEFYYFYLSYRLPIGFDNSQRIAADNGVHFHLSCWYYNTQRHCLASSLLDMQPQVAYRYTLPVGASYQDPGYAGTYFEVLSADDNGAYVQIVLGTSGVHIEETTWGQLKAKEWGNRKRKWRR